MQWDIVAPMILGIVFFLTVGGVILLRPISKRLGDLIELYARDRQSGLQTEVQHLRDQLESVNARLQLLEDRQDFTDRLLAPGDPARGRGPELPRSG